jgi:hypothetical protein
MDKLAKEDNGGSERARKLCQTELDGDTIIASHKDEIQENRHRHVNIEDGLVVEQEHVKRVDDEQRIRLLARGNAMREVKVAKQQEYLPNMPQPNMPLREGDVVGHQQQACDRRVKPRRYLGEEAIGEPESHHPDGEDGRRDLQL